MRANFYRRSEDLWVFLETGDTEALEEGVVSDLHDLSRSADEGRIRLNYDPDYTLTKPGIVRSNGDLEVVIGDKVYDRLLSGDDYSGRAGEYQELHSESTVRIMPEDGVGAYEDMFEELEN